MLDTRNIRDGLKFALAMSLIKYDLVQYLPVHLARHQKY